MLCGLDSIDAKRPEDYQDKLLTHLRRIRSSRATQHATLVFIFENNLGMEAGHLRQFISEAGITNTITLNEKELKDGLNTKSRIKKDMAFLLNQELEQERLMISGAIVSSSPCEEVLASFQHQLHAYQVVKTVPTNNITGRVTTHYTGKISSGAKVCTRVVYVLTWPPGRYVRRFPASALLAQMVLGI